MQVITTWDISHALISAKKRNTKNTHQKTLVNQHKRKITNHRYKVMVKTTNYLSYPYNLPDGDDPRGGIQNFTYSIIWWNTLQLLKYHWINKHTTIEKIHAISLQFTSSKYSEGMCILFNDYSLIIFNMSRRLALFWRNNNGIRNPGNPNKVIHSTREPENQKIRNCKWMQVTSNR